MVERDTANHQHFSAVAFFSSRFQNVYTEYPDYDRNSTGFEAPLVGRISGSIYRRHAVGM